VGAGARGSCGCELCCLSSSCRCGDGSRARLQDWAQERRPAAARPQVAIRFLRRSAGAWPRPSARSSLRPSPRGSRLDWQARHPTSPVGSGGHFRHRRGWSELDRCKFDHDRGGGFGRLRRFAPVHHCRSDAASTTAAPLKTPRRRSAPASSIANAIMDPAFSPAPPRRP
jgi:hypothetical protein